MLTNLSIEPKISLPCVGCSRYEMLKKTGEFVINLTTRDLAFATDYCGVKSGRDVDKFKEMKLTPMPAEKISAPLIKESPVNIECKVTQTIPLGTHDMFLAEVVAVHADEAYMDEKGKFSFTKAQPLVYYAWKRNRNLWLQCQEKKHRQKEDKLRLIRQPIKPLSAVFFCVLRRSVRCVLTFRGKETAPHNSIVSEFVSDIIQRFIKSGKLFECRLLFIPRTCI